MFYSIIIGYTVLFVAFIAVSFGDWLFGIDKFNPMIERLTEKYFPYTDFDFLMPTVGLTVIGLLSLLMYAFTSFIAFHVIYFFAVSIGFILISIVVVAWLIGKLCSSIRKYFISKKYQ